MWTGAILAGGRSRRLGGLNKATRDLAPLGGASVLDRQLARLRRVVDRTIIIANDAEAFRATGVPVIPDRTLVMACDMPFVSEALLGRCAQPTPARRRTSCCGSSRRSDSSSARWPSS